jgi:hypothetical protein
MEMVVLVVAGPTLKWPEASATEAADLPSLDREGATAACIGVNDIVFNDVETSMNSRTLPHSTLNPDGLVLAKRDCDDR